MIELLLAAVVFASAGAAIMALRRRQAAKAPPALPPPPRCVDKGEINPGDVIVHLGTDSLVEGVAILREGGRTVLVVARLGDGPEERFLIIDPEGAPRCISGKRTEHGSGGHAVPNMLLHENLELRLASRAAMRLFCQGDFGFPKDAACEVGRYQGPGQRAGVMLLVEGEELVIVGRSVAEAGIELLQGDLARKSQS